MSTKTRIEKLEAKISPEEIYVVRMEANETQQQAIDRHCEENNIPKAAQKEGQWVVVRNFSWESLSDGKDDIPTSPKQCDLEA